MVRKGVGQDRGDEVMGRKGRMRASGSKLRGG